MLEDLKEESIVNKVGGRFKLSACMGACVIACMCNLRLRNSQLLVQDSLPRRHGEGHGEASWQKVASP